VKDLHLGERLLSQTPAEEFRYTMFYDKLLKFFGCPIHAKGF